MTAQLVDGTGKAKRAVLVARLAQTGLALDSRVTEALPSALTVAYYPLIEARPKRQVLSEWPRGFEGLGLEEYVPIPSLFDTDHRFFATTPCPDDNVGGIHRAVRVVPDTRE